jgi:enterochelin esterase-like enzyme
LSLQWQPRADATRACDAGPRNRVHVHRGFRSRYLPGARDIAIYVPPGYGHHPGRSYPVLYLQDGQNLFDGQPSFIPGQTWRVDEHADAAIAAGEVEPLIVVGIYNAGDRRIAEYTHERNEQLQGGEAELYGQMITRELMPWVAEHYRVRGNREATGLGGSSLGALVSLYLGLSYPETFGRLALLSPSVWWNKNSILGFVDQKAAREVKRARIWLDAGDREGERSLQDAGLLVRFLEGNGWRAEDSLHFERVAGGTHDEASWAGRVRPMLRFLFPA